MNLSKYFKSITQKQWAEETNVIRNTYSEIFNCRERAFGNPLAIEQSKIEKAAEITKCKDIVLSNSIISSISAVLQKISQEKRQDGIRFTWTCFNERTLRLISKSNQYRDGVIKKEGWTVDRWSYYWEPNVIIINYNHDNPSFRHYRQIQFCYSEEDAFYWCQWKLEYGEWHYSKCDDLTGFIKFIHWVVDKPEKRQ